MDMRSGLDGLRSLLGVPQPGTSSSSPVRNGAPAGSSAAGADRATLSQAASQASQAFSSEDVRMDKVASIQAALAAGSYSVPASAVASRVVDNMLAIAN